LLILELGVNDAGLLTFDGDLALASDGHPQ